MKRSILVTGSHKAGTTWIGKVLGEAPATKYVHEPFNMASEDAKVLSKWYKYIDLKTGPTQGEYSYVNSIFGDQSTRAIYKAPLALFAAPWLVRTYRLLCVLCARNPLAFVGSIKAKGWTFNFDDFIGQPELVNNYFPQYWADMKDDLDYIDKCILLWNILYSVIHIYRKKYPGWLYIRHEDISQSPHDIFELMYDYLGLNYTNHIRTYITSHMKDRKGKDGYRDPVKNLSTWRDRLTDEEIERIIKGTRNVALLHGYDLNKIDGVNNGC